MRLLKEDSGCPGGPRSDPLRPAPVTLGQPLDLPHRQLQFQCRLALAPMPSADGTDHVRSIQFFPAYLQSLFYFYASS